MTKKKKEKEERRKKLDAEHRMEQEEELVALEAIFGDEFRAHVDGLGADVTIVPHPGELESNFVTCDLHIR